LQAPMQQGFWHSAQRRRGDMYATVSRFLPRSLARSYPHRIAGAA
jgi:hypothetical protein